LGAGFHGVNGLFLANGAGNNNEGNLALYFTRDFKRGGGGSE
jgi:hypothetical protein